MFDTAMVILWSKKCFFLICIFEEFFVSLFLPPHILNMMEKFNLLVVNMIAIIVQRNQIFQEVIYQR